MQKRTGRGAAYNRPRTEVKTKKKRKGKNIDYVFLVLIIIMFCAGLIMVLSASAPAANSKFGDSYHFFARQLVFGLAGLVGMFIMSRIDYHKFKKWSRYIILCGVILLALVLIPGIGSYYNGARRWIPLGPIQLQPSELVKVAVAIHFASLVESKKGKLKTIYDIAEFVIWLGIIAVLMLLEPHLSGTIVICGIGAVILVVGGLHSFWICGGCLMGGTALAALITFLPNKRARFLSFLDPFADAQNMGWQVVQSLYAIGSGSLFGLGLGNSRQKYTYLPEPYNDFIFSVISEELGLFGVILLVIMFIAFIWRGTKIAMEAPDTFGSLLVVGIIAQVAIQAILNIAVATSSIPNTGVSLPFFSYGGTAIMVLFAELGIVLNVSRYTRKNDAV